MADRILVGKALQVLGSCLWRNLRNIGTLWRRNDIERIAEEYFLLHGICSNLMVQADNDVLILTEGCLGKAILATLGSPDHHVALTCRKEGLSICHGIFGYHSAELRIVVYLEIHSCAIHWVAGCIFNREIDAGRRTIVVDEIDLGIVRGAEHHFLRTIIIAECLGMHQHGTRGRSIKPSQIQHGFRLTGTQEIPGTICPSLNPGMVIVGMCPTRGINLSCRNADSSQGSHGESTLLATSSVSRTDGRKRCRSSTVRWLISYQLVTPVVHFEDGFLHAQSLYALLQFLEEHHA